MTPDDVQKACDLLESFNEQQASLVEYASAGIAVWVNGRNIAGGAVDRELQATVRDVLLGRQQARMAATTASLAAMGVDAPKLAPEAVAALAVIGKPLPPLFEGQTAMAVMADAGRPITTQAGNDRMPGGQA